MADPCLESNQWVTLSMSPLSQLQVNLNPSARVGNAFQLGTDGIFVPGFQKATVPPLGAEDGDLWTWESPDQAVTWSFIYSDVQGKWVFQGGGELYDEVAASGTRAQTGSPAYADLTAVGGGGSGPTVTVPFAGAYVAHYGARVAAANDGQGAMMSLTYGATATDTDAVRQANQYTASVGRRKTIIIGVAGQQISAKYKNTSSAGGDATWADRFLYLRPVSL